MKTYSGKKWHTFSYYERFSELFQMKCFVTPKQWMDIVSLSHRTMKGGHTHNYLRNALERKLNKSKASRNRCHNYLNRQGV